MSVVEGRSDIQHVDLGSPSCTARPGHTFWHKTVHPECPLLGRLVKVKQTYAGEDVFDAIDPEETLSGLVPGVARAPPPAEAANSPALLGPQPQPSAASSWRHCPRAPATCWPYRGKRDAAFAPPL